MENNRPYPVTAGYQKSVTADRPGPGLCEGMESELAPKKPSQTYPYQRRNFVHKIGGFCGENAFFQGFVHRIGGFCGQNLLV